MAADIYNHAVIVTSETMLEEVRFLGAVVGYGKCRCHVDVNGKRLGKCFLSGIGTGNSLACDMRERVDKHNRACALIVLSTDLNAVATGV